MDSGNLNQGHAIRAENLSLAGLCPVNRGVDGHVMGNMGGSAVGCGNHVSHAITFAVGVGGTLVETVKKHCKAFLSIDGWCLVV